MQHYTATIKTNRTKLPNKKSLNINLAYLETDSMTDEIFGMNAYLETNYHIAFDEIDRVFGGNAIHCAEVKHSTSDDYKQLKYYGGWMNPATVPPGSKKLKEMSTLPNVDGPGMDSILSNEKTRQL